MTCTAMSKASRKLCSRHDAKHACCAAHGALPGDPGWPTVHWPDTGHDSITHSTQTMRSPFAAHKASCSVTRCLSCAVIVFVIAPLNQALRVTHC